MEIAIGIVLVIILLVFLVIAFLFPHIVLGVSRSTDDLPDPEQTDQAASSSDKNSKPEKLK